MPRPSVVVIGDALLDVHVLPHEAPRQGGDARATIRHRPGGQGANVAVRLARQGIATELVCGLGQDPAAAILRAALDAEGVQVSPVPTSASGTVVVLAGAGGERTMLSDRAPFAAAAADAISTHPPAPWVVLSGYPLLEDDAAALSTALATLPSRRLVAGCAVPAPMVERWRSMAAAVKPHLVVLNSDEARTLAIGAMVDGTVVTDAGGASASVAGVDVQVQAPAGAPATDTTGAGDAFTAGVVAGLLEASWPPTHDALTAALRRGVSLAGEVARSTGAQAVVEGERPVEGR